MNSGQSKYDEIERVWAKIKTNSDHLASLATQLKNAALTHAPQERIDELHSVQDAALNKSQVFQAELEDAFRTLGINI